MNYQQILNALANATELKTIYSGTTDVCIECRALRSNVKRIILIASSAKLLGKHLYISLSGTGQCKYFKLWLTDDSDGLYIDAYTLIVGDRKLGLEELII